MHWHIETDIICLIIMTAMFANLRRRDFSTIQQDSVFKAITKVTICCIAIDIGASLAMDFATSWWLYQILDVLYFATLPILPMMWFYYICLVIYPKFTRKNRCITGLFMMPGCILALLCLSNPFTDFVFTLSPDMEYSRGPFFEVSYYMLAFYTIISFFIVIKKKDEIIPKSRIWIFLSFFIIISVAVFVQINVPGVLVIYAAYTIIFVITHYYIQNRTAFTDSLTGLYNRATGEQKADDFIMQNNNNDDKMAFIITDLDHFKTINDTFGHKMGDVVLRAAADACKEAFPVNSVLSRLGGDEFLILYTDYSDDEELTATLASVGTIMKERLLKVAPECADTATISMGISIFPDHGSNFMELYENADIALYQGKWAGRNRWVIFDSDNKGFMTESVHGYGYCNGAGDTSVAKSLPAMREKTILIIDDDEVSRNILENMFKDDFFILQAEDSVAALRLLRRHGVLIDIILLDLLMPQKDGFDFLEEKKDYIPCKNIPVVVVTGSEDKDDHRRAIECGATDILTKPIDIDNAKLTVRNVLMQYGVGFRYNDIYQKELLNLANAGLNGGMICVYDQPGHPLEYISLSFVKFLGYENHHDLYQKNDGKWDNLIYEEDLISILDMVNRELKEGGEYTKLEYRLKREDGKIVWIRDSGKILRFSAGKDVIVALCIDVTDTRQPGKDT